MTHRARWFAAGWLSSVLAAVGAIKLAVVLDRWRYERRQRAERAAWEATHPTLPGVTL